MVKETRFMVKIAVTPCIYLFFEYVWFWEEPGNNSEPHTLKEEIHGVTAIVTINLVSFIIKTFKSYIHVTCILKIDLWRQVHDPMLMLGDWFTWRTSRSEVGISKKRKVAPILLMRFLMHAFLNENDFGCTSYWAGIFGISKLFVP